MPALVASLSITGGVLGAKYLGWLQTIELNALDRMIRLQAMVGDRPTTLDDRFLIVEIDDQDLQNFQQIPLTDDIVATALENLQKHDPKVIGLDIYRNIPNPPGTKRLATQLAKENLIAIYNPQHGLPLDSSGENIQENQGFNLVIIDSDNIQRRKLLALRSENRPLYSFGLLVSQVYLGESDHPIELEDNGLKLGSHYIPAINQHSGGYRLPASEARGWQTLLQFSAQQQIAQSVTISDIVAETFDPELVQDRIVLIGSTAKTQKDTFMTPYSVSKTDGHLTPGVFLHAQAIQKILDTATDGDHFFSYWTEGQEFVWIFIWASIGGATTWLFYRTKLFVGVSIGNVTILCGSSYLLFLSNVWIPVAAPIIALFVSWSSVLAYRLFYEEKYDVLTGLQNRDSFLQQVSLSNASLTDPSNTGAIAVLSVDIDRFKSINESYGHYHGDAILKQVVQRLRSQLPQDRQLARMGANEFGILVSNLTTDTAVIDIVDNIKRKLKEPFQINEQKLYLTCSTGVALHTSETCITAEDLWLQAHTAMNRAKTSRRGNYEIFAAGMQTQSLNRLTLESDLRQAIEQDEFQLVYQPIFAMDTGLLQGFEALVRWHSPTRGLVSPNRFISIAEETDLILPIGQWVLEEGCRQFKEWQETLNLDERLVLSINLSSRQFSQSNLKKSVETILKNTGLDASSLKLEVTESMVMDDIKETIKTLNELKTLNVKLSIDDFGTGYSSLSYLNDFPVDTLKIDRSFVSKISEKASSLAIPSAVIALGHNLGMDIVAEGIENISQFQILKSLNCEYGQGFFFAKPLERKAVTPFLKKWNNHPFDPDIFVTNSK
ncbi:EAL domain-containing protein [[Leptolyngbya] sp. PCC 7376]|uniref:EAL domain-containing protein n=1 Tax=[Leptolyngbya] sp. PCC 7376 TaxID=111781 RepID=UPI0003148B52|nr:EAL domain-containing protein [[Leptolyngbya] sp. PCC 7376]